MKIFIASDHAGYDLKAFLLDQLANKLSSFELVDHGTFDKNSCDYPDYAKKVVLDVSSDKSNYGILICGSGIGMSIAANRNDNIYAALVNNHKAAKLAKEHNNANIIVFGQNFISNEEALKSCLAFFEAKFENDRHLRRINKIFKIN